MVTTSILRFSKTFLLALNQCLAGSNKMIASSSSSSTTTTKNDEKFLREVDSNIYKMLESYRTLIQKSNIGESVAVHEEFQIQVVTASLVCIK